jgi:hypothetical protein
MVVTFSFICSSGLLRDLAIASAIKAWWVTSLAAGIQCETVKMALSSVSGYAFKSPRMALLAISLVSGSK